MKIVQGEIGFIFPDVHLEPSEHPTQFNIEAVKQWVLDIPDDNIGSYAKQIYGFLKILNETKCSTSSRLEILEILYPRVKFINQTMTKRFLDDYELEHDKKLNILVLINAINLVQCAGYKYVIESLNTVSRKNKDDLLLCLHRATTLSLETLQKSYQLYTSPPQFLWKELHLLYSYANSIKLLNNPLTDSDLRSTRHQTIAHAYKHALLLACSNPYRLRSSELTKLNFSLESWAPLLELQPFKTPDLFLVDLQEDSPPRYVKLKFDPSPSTLSLNFGKIINHLDKLLQFKNNSEKSSEGFTLIETQIPVNILEFLVSSWTQFSSRGSDRMSQMGTIRITIGLQDTFKALESVSNDNLETNKLINNQDCSEEIIMDQVLGSYSSQAESTPFVWNQASLVNLSPTGYCLEFKTPFHKLFKTGEIIGLEQNPELKSLISIGVIRWIKHINNTTTHCGVQILSPYAKPVFASIPNQSRPISIRTLLLAAEPRFNPFISLITPTLPFKENTNIEVSHLDETYPLSLHSTIDSFSAFKVFHVQFNDNQSIEFHAKTIPPSDELWRTLDALL